MRHRCSKCGASFSRATHVNSQICQLGQTRCALRKSSLTTIQNKSARLAQILGEKPQEVLSHWNRYKRKAETRVWVSQKCANRLGAIRVASRMTSISAEDWAWVLGDEGTHDTLVSLLRRRRTDEYEAYHPSVLRELAKLSHQVVTTRPRPSVEGACLGLEYKGRSLRCCPTTLEIVVGKGRKWEPLHEIAPALAAEAALSPAGKGTKLPLVYVAARLILGESA